MFCLEPITCLLLARRFENVVNAMKMRINGLGASVSVLGWEFSIGLSKEVSKFEDWNLAVFLSC